MRLIHAGAIRKLLKHFSGTITVTNSTKQYAATNIHAGVSVGELLVFSGFTDATSNGIKTVATVSTGAITVEESVGANAAEAAEYNEMAATSWERVEDAIQLTGVINCDQDALLYIDQGFDDEVKYTTPVMSVTGETTLAWEIAVVLPKARMRVANNGTLQDSMEAVLYKRVVI